VLSPLFAGVFEGRTDQLKIIQPSSHMNTQTPAVSSSHDVKSLDQAMTTRPPHPRLFSFEGKEIRTFERNDGAHFIADDILMILGVTSFRDALKSIPPEEQGRVMIVGDTYESETLTDRGLCRLIIGCQTPVATRFWNWAFLIMFPIIYGEWTTPESHLPAPASVAQAGADLLGPLTRLSRRQRRKIADAISSALVWEVVPKGAYADHRVESD
jgi:hypothetical protein